MTWRFDCHVHSHHSNDAKGSVMELAEAAQANGLHGFALTDHDTVAGHDEIPVAMEATGIFILPSIEVSSAEGHILGFGVTEAPAKGKSFETTREAIELQGGLAVPAHPLKTFSGMGPQGLRDHQANLPAVEARNGRERRIVQENTERLVASLGLPMMAGSDAHWIRDIGTTYTTFDGPPADAGALLDMIRDGLCRPGGGNIARHKVYAHGLSLALPRKLRRSR